MKTEWPVLELSLPPLHTNTRPQNIITANDIHFNCLCPSTYYVLCTQKNMVEAKDAQTREDETDKTYIL